MFGNYNAEESNVLVKLSLNIQENERFVCEHFVKMNEMLIETKIYLQKYEVKYQEKLYNDFN
ncbi:hypothetical protein Bhyg_03568 [Pseudolycoriella hygida]|uniref:Uncharacterized protein n=1 Tax=Pseudolycoriella hygida TaxID=35572 RepID=A0A9Q0S9L1_9DIPT|nr:hypothetical protein Bhyg_03568 [Pseudolycoriella hygida]